MVIIYWMQSKGEGRQQQQGTVGVKAWIALVQNVWVMPHSGHQTALIQNCVGHAVF